MFSLISGFLRLFFAKPTYKVLFLGLDGAGKTVNIFLMLIKGTFIIRQYLTR